MSSRNEAAPFKMPGACSGTGALIYGGEWGYDLYVGENGAFERLSANISQYERVKLLEKIGSFTDASERMLIISEKEAAPQEKAETVYSRLPWYKRLWFFIVGFFTGKTRLDAFIHSQIADIGRSIELLFPGMFDWQKGLLRQNLHLELKRLKEAARFFYGVLDAGISRNIGDFLVFLGSVEMKDIHAELSERTQPENFTAENPGVPDIKLQQMAVNLVEEEIDRISEESRQVMYDSAHYIACLKNLASFLFDRLIMSFSKMEGYIEPVCPASSVRNQLAGLNNSLYSIKRTPSQALLTAMFIFTMPEYTAEQDYDAESEMQKFVSRAEKAIEIIRAFNHRVPLTRILRCVLRNTGYLPSELPGGEDWFVLYRKTWIDNVMRQFNEFIKERHKARIQTLCDTLFGHDFPDPFENYDIDSSEDGIPVNNIQTLSFLLTFHKLIFMPVINVFIRPILIDGDFINKENKTEFTEAYNVLIKLDDTIKNAVQRIDTNGDYGKRWGQIIMETQSVTVRRRKMGIIIEDVSTMVNTIIHDAEKSIVSMEFILDGILNPMPGKSYDTLTNIAKIIGKGTSFTDGLKTGLEKLKSMTRLLDEVSKLNKMD
jgi:hypothetical protein